MAVAYPFANVGDKYLVTFVGRFNGQRIMNTFWYQLKEMVGNPTVDQIYDELFASLDDNFDLRGNYLDVTPSNFTLLEIWVQRIDGLRVVKKVYQKNVPGLVPNEFGTQNVQATIVRRGLTGSRKAVGAVRIPAPTGTATSGTGTWVQGYRDKLELLAASMKADQTTQSGHILQPVIRHGPSTVDVDLVAQTFSMPEVRVMSRRTVGRGI